jgi:hypothetical protein
VDLCSACRHKKTFLSVSVAIDGGANARVVMRRDSGPVDAHEKRLSKVNNSHVGDYCSALIGASSLHDSILYPFRSTALLCDQMSHLSTRSRCVVSMMRCRLVYIRHQAVLSLPHKSKMHRTAHNRCALRLLLNKLDT